MQATVSLTYDDGIGNHLDIAMPALEARGFRGTFYLTTMAEWMRERKDEWRAAFSRGHEIGNHTAHHPAWNRPGAPASENLARMNAEMIDHEVREAAAWLDREIGVDPGRTFAYPYNQCGIGPDQDRAPYDRAVRRYCAGARSGGGQKPLTRPVDPYALQGVSLGSGAQIDTLIRYCEAAIAQSGWIILNFHGIGGPWLETSKETHAALLDYLQTAPIRVVTVRDGLQCFR